MKFGITVSTYETKFGPIIYKDGNLDKNIPEIKSLGYDGVDLFINNKSKSELLEIKKIFNSYDIEINTFLAIFLAEKGVKLSEINHKKRIRDIELFKEQIYNAKLVGAKSIALGFIRGGIEENDSYEECEKRLADSLYIVGEYARKNDIIIGLEPINRYELNFLNSADETIKFVNKYKFEGVKLLLDTFHMNIEDSSFKEAILNAKGLISNIHAPSSHRQAPGTGHLNYDEIFDALKQINYTGYITLEAFPKPDSSTCAKMSIEFYKKYINK